MDPVPTTVEIDGEYYLNEYLKLKAENQRLKLEIERLKGENEKFREIHNEKVNYRNPYYLSNQKLNELMNIYCDEIRPNYSHIRGIAKARALSNASSEFFEKESPELELWLKTHGILK